MTNEENLEECQDRFDVLTETIEDDVQILHEKFKDVDSNQINLELRWNRLYAKLCWLLKEAEKDSDSSFSQAYTQACSNGYKNVSATEAKHLASGDVQYTVDKTFENDVFRLKKEVEAIVEALETRKYILKDLAALTIHNVKDTLI